MIKRDAEKSILKGAKYFPVVAILGPRQSGKTTLAKMIFTKHTYLSLEDLDIRSAAINDPRTFLLANRNKHGIIIDEFQHAPDLLSYIQTIVDDKQQPGYFILTGSQNFLMNQAITQSLAGRVSIHTLLPLSYTELSKSSFLLPSEIETMLYKGSYPAIYAKNIDPSLLYSNYIHTYVERDVRQLTHVGDLGTFQTFLSLCAARIGQLLNITSLGNDCGISDNTAKRWLAILEASYIIILLRPYHNNFGKRLVKSPKIYFYDTGLACRLLRIKEKDLAMHPQKGGLFESFVISELSKIYYNKGETPPLYFWRDRTGHEIDCIIDQGTTITAIEIKSARTINKRFFKNINYLNNLTQKKISNFVVFAGSSQQIKTHENIVSWQSLHKVIPRT